jgi:hypothetical protein
MEQVYKSADFCDTCLKIIHYYIGSGLGGPLGKYSLLLLCVLLMLNWVSSGGIINDAFGW